MQVRIPSFLVAALLWAAGACAQTLYKVVSPEGKISYSSQKPEGKIARTLVYAAPPTGAVQPRQRQVLLYTAAWCGYCAKAKAYLAAANIRYEEIDAETSYGRGAFARATGAAPIPESKPASGIPYLVMGEVKQRGFSSETYDRIFAKSTGEPGQ